MKQLINRRVTALMAALCLVASLAYAAPQPKVVISTERITPAASSALTVPANADYVIITVRTAGVHIDFGAGAATTADPYFPTGVYIWEQQKALVTAMRFITSSDGTAVVDAVYLRSN